MGVTIQLPNKSLPYHHEDYPGSLRIGLAAIGRVRHRFPPISHGSRSLPSISTSTAAVPEPAERRLLSAAGAAPAARPLMLQVQLPRGARLVSGERGLHAEGVAILLWLRLLHPDHPVRPGWMFTL